MTRYIDAEEFIEDIKAENTNLIMDGLKGTPRRMALSAEDVVERINAVPTADVQEVKHGRWIEASDKSKVGKKCSICGARIKYSEYFNGNHLYCHKCGARMDGDDNAEVH